MEARCRRTGVKRLLSAGLTCAAVAATLTGCTGSSLPSSIHPSQPSSPSTDTTTATQTRETATSRPAPSDHGTLTDREFSVAVAIARRELNKNPPWSVPSVTATASHGTVLHGNVGPHRQCLSGTLLNIRFIGRFPNILHDVMPGQKYFPIRQVLVVADPVSGYPCLLSVQTGHRTPGPGATTLFAR